MPTPARTVAPADLVARLRALDRDLGTSKAAERLGISQETFARLVAGLGVRKGTVALALQSFASLDAAKESAGNPGISRVECAAR